MKEKENKKKFKIKKKTLIIILIIFVVLISGGGIAFKIYYDKTLKTIRQSYNKYVITNKNINLYDKKQKIIGKMSEQYKLELAKAKISNLKMKYFNIKDTDYYLYYEDIKKVDKIDDVKINDNYVMFNKNIQTNKKITVTDKNNNKIVLNKGINAPILYHDKDNYYVDFLNNIFIVKKDNSIKEIVSNNTKDAIANHVSSFFYERIEDGCNDYNCISYANFKEQIIKLKENGYYTITASDYVSYLNNYINLKDKAIYISTNNENDGLNNLKNELGIVVEKNDEAVTGLKLIANNKTANIETKTEELNTYQIKSYSSIDNILKMANGEEVHEQEPARPAREQSIAVLNYHFFYDPTLGESCNEGICLTVQKFREHLEWLKNNNYKTLTMNEFRRWMYGEIELPTKSVLITVDDGAMGTGAHNGNKLIPLLEEYDMHATLFLITAWWDINNYRSPNLDVQSHAHDMHEYGSCGRGRINCVSYDEAMSDLRQSLDIIGNDDSFCFPFYMYNNTSLQAVKDSGFKLAFVGGNVQAKRSNNKFLVPRFPIHSDITLDNFINIVS